ncbi:MAG: hypothetical protein JWM93_1780, partial [Frankiales bacterium]|nr:hypothetical protein [Frankiales bacterium]
RHHTLVHDDGWVCVRDGTGWIVLPPELARERYRDGDEQSPVAPPDAPSTRGFVIPTILRGLTAVPSAWLDQAALTCAD